MRKSSFAMAAAMSLASFSAVEAGEIDDAAMRAWIMSNPAVIAEALQRHQVQLREDQVRVQHERAMAQLPAMRDGAPFIGNPEGSVEIVMFSDYRCPHCRSLHGEISQLLEEDDDIRVTVRELPILGEDSVLAARYALSVHEAFGPDAYRAVHDRMFETSAAVDAEWIAADMEGSDAAGLGVFDDVMDDASFRHLVETDRIAKDLEVMGTPFLIIGETVVPGGLDLESLKHLVDLDRATR